MTDDETLILAHTAFVTEEIVTLVAGGFASQISAVMRPPVANSICAVRRIFRSLFNIRYAIYLSPPLYSLSF